MTSSSATVEARPWAPLRHTAYRMLFGAQFVSNIGTWMQTVGAQWFVVQNAHSPALVAWVQTADTLPVLLLSLIAGAAADLVDRRRLLIVLSLVSVIIAAGLTVITFAGLLGPWSLLGLTFLLGCTAALTSPAWQAVQPELVPREELPQAASLGTVTVNGARAIGPAVAGVIVAASGPAVVFALNTLSFLAVTTALLAWHRSSPQRAGAERAVPGIIAGIRYVRSAPGVRRILLRCALFAVPASALWALLPTAAHQLMGTGSGGYSALLALLGVGAIIGALMISIIRRLLSRSMILISSALLFGLGTFAAGWWPLPVTMICSVAAGLAWMMTLTTLNATMQLSLPPWVRARGLASYLLIFMGSQAVGSFLWGIVADRVGVRWALTVAAGLLILVALSVIMLPVLTASGSLDRTIVPLASGEPTLFLGSDQQTPIAVRIHYRVGPGERAAFTAAMRDLRRSRERTGAVRWRLLRNGDDDHDFVEEFSVASVHEHQLQHTDRWTGYDAELYHRVLELVAAPPQVTHYLISAGRL